MDISIEAEIQGEDELKQNIRKLIKSMDPEKVGPVLLEGAGIIERRVYANAPVGPTGNLKAAVYKNLSPKKMSAFVGIRPKKAPHAHLVEYGHGGIHPAPPHPFFRPAWDETRLESLGTIQNGLQKNIEGAI